MSWEYKIVQGPKERNMNRIISEEELAMFDNQQWELVTAFSSHNSTTGKFSSDREQIYYIFRRARK